MSRGRKPRSDTVDQGGGSRGRSGKTPRPRVSHEPFPPSPNGHASPSPIGRIRGPDNTPPWLDAVANFFRESRGFIARLCMERGVPLGHVEDCLALAFTQAFFFLERRYGSGGATYTGSAAEEKYI